MTQFQTPFTSVADIFLPIVRYIFEFCRAPSHVLWTHDHGTFLYWVLVQEKYRAGLNAAYFADILSKYICYFVKH